METLQFEGVINHRPNLTRQLIKTKSICFLVICCRRIYIICRDQSTMYLKTFVFSIYFDIISQFLLKKYFTNEIHGLNCKYYQLIIMVCCLQTILLFTFNNWVFCVAAFFANFDCIVIFRITFFGDCTIQNYFFLSSPTDINQRIKSSVSPKPLDETTTM